MPRLIPPDTGRKEGICGIRKSISATMRNKIIALFMLIAGIQTAAAQQAEYLDRGAIAVLTDDGVFVSWRSLAGDDDAMTFDVYRDGTTKVNDESISAGTNLTDSAGTAQSAYTIKALVDGEVVETTEITSVWADGYLRVCLDRPDGGTTPADEDYTYTPNDCSVGDVDGDGQYELFVKWNPSNAHDNSERGYTGNVYIDCYKLDGTKLWRIDLGRNIRAGAHYTQFMVYDFDGDGKAEMACKTAPGTVDGEGNNVLMDGDSADDDYRGTSGKTTGVIVSGSEYLTMFDGETGAEITTVAYVPSRDVQSQSSSGWGDNYGNRSERYLACVAYLDGEKPSLVMCRGYYTHAYLCAWDFDGESLTQRWLHSSTTSGSGAYGEGAHSLSVGDVDGDGCDEIIYGAACIDHDGSLLYRTGAGHGDALHLGDFDPDRDGLEVFMVHEETGSSYKWDSDFHDAATGEIIWGTEQSGNDIGRGLVGDISDNWRGYEIWPGSYYENGTNVNATFDCKGNLLVNKRPSTCFRIYWDGDLNDELFDGNYSSSSESSSPKITKRNATLTGTSKTWSFSSYSAQSCNTTKATPCLSADILGDWREELILWDGDNSTDLLLFTTTIESSYRVPCLMQDHNYRMAIAWQNVAYNQPPHLGYYLPDLYSTDASIATDNGSGNTTQTIELGYAIEDISGTWKNATALTADGLPDGVELTQDTDSCTFVISGTPTAVGTFNFTITTVGGETTATLEGKITVRENVELTPLLYLPFETIGTTTVNEVYGEATAVGSPSTEEGIIGNAAVLDGTTQYFIQDAYDSIQLGERDFTIEMWIKSTDDAAYIIHKGSITASSTTGATGKWVGLEFKSGNLKFAIDDNDNKSEASAAASDYFNGEWTYIVCVRAHSDGYLYLYVNGELIASSTDDTGDISDNNEAFVAGNVNVTFDNYFEGSIDELTIYDGAMSANKVRESYENATTGITGVGVTSTVSRLTLVSATTGMVVAEGVGNVENVTNKALPGYYILVIDDGTTRTVRKFVKK